MEKLVSFAKKFVTVPRISALVATLVLALVVVGASQAQNRKPVATKTTPQAATQNNTKTIQQTAQVATETPAPKPDATPSAASPSTTSTAQPKTTPKAAAPQASSSATIVVIPQIMASDLTVESDPICTLSYTFGLNYSKFAYTPPGVMQDSKNLVANLSVTFGPGYDLAPVSVSDSFTMSPGQLTKTMQLNINKTSGNGGTYIEFPVTLHLVVSAASPSVSFESGNTFVKDIPAQCH